MHGLETVKRPTPLKLICSSLVASLALAGNAISGPLAVDGNLADWGITVADNNASVLIPSIPTLYYAIEDQSDTAGDGGFVGPNYGGQNYDVEFMGVAKQGTRIYIALVSGLRPDNGFPRFGPGDIRIVVGGTVFGIEVGGGAGGGAGGAITEGATGSTYVLDSNGFTVGHNAAVAAQTAGSIWRNSAWILDPISPQTPVQFQGGTYVGTADYIYTRDSVTQQHSIIELSFEAGVLGDASSLEIFWGPSCGNDVLEVEGQYVPEPGVLSLLAFGLTGIVVGRRKHPRRS
jgi:hypothetical protein